MPTRSYSTSSPTFPQRNFPERQPVKEDDVPDLSVQWTGDVDRIQYAFDAPPMRLLIIGLAVLFGLNRLFDQRLSVPSLSPSTFLLTFGWVDVNLLFYILICFLLQHNRRIHSYSVRLHNLNKQLKPPTPRLTNAVNGLADTVTSNDSLILDQLIAGDVKSRDLESLCSSIQAAVKIRRLYLARLLPNSHTIDSLPYDNYDYRFVHGQCCEEVIGYIPIPVGKIGPLLLDSKSHYLPLATTEGCLVASANRGCRALFLSGGVASIVHRDHMTRAPVVYFNSLNQLAQCIEWLESTRGFELVKSAFDQTSGHIDLTSIFANPSGRYLHIRFAAQTGDAMGMNMVSKASLAAVKVIKQKFPEMEVISLSGNMCTDKKAAAVNTLLGRGKSVIAEAVLTASVVARVLHSSPQRLVRLAQAKNWLGSAASGCLGMSGCNAHAANIVAGLFAATGQDLAQVVDASACLTHLELLPPSQTSIDNQVASTNSSSPSEDQLLITVTMPCVEVGTIGGGTKLPPQRACIDLMNLDVDRPTEHLARLTCAAVLAGELNLLAALDTDDLVNAHMALNRCAKVTSNKSSDLRDKDKSIDEIHRHSVDVESMRPPHLHYRTRFNSQTTDSIHPVM